MRVRLANGSTWDRVLTIILVSFIVGAVGVLGYIVVTPGIGEKFTEFYILGPGGKAANYPKELAVGEEGKVIIGIINREHKPLTYQVEVRIDSVRNNEAGPVVLEHNEKWEKVVSFTPNKRGDNQKVEFLLYKQGRSGGSQSLYLWINVK